LFGLCGVIGEVAIEALHPFFYVWGWGVNRGNKAKIVFISLFLILKGIRGCLDLYKYRD
jgi:hypothetical protein